jgi:hypothetical protein
MKQTAPAYLGWGCLFLPSAGGAWTPYPPLLKPVETLDTRDDCHQVFLHGEKNGFLHITN